MSASPMSIGEPEGSQDTPLRNTTPLNKRRGNYGPRSGTAKKTKPNQCMQLFNVMVTTRQMEDKFDPSDDWVDGLYPVDAADEDLAKEEASIREVKEENDELLQLIQQFQDKSAATKQSDDCLSAGVAGFGTTFGSQQSEPANVDMPDYDERLDDLVVRQCTEAHGKRADALQSALETNEKVKQQVQSFKVELRQVQADCTAQSERVRLEYQARLSQQRRELEEKAEKRKEKFNKKLDEKQRVIDEMSYTAASVHRSKSADADAAIAELPSKLTAAETARDDANSELSAANGRLEMVVKDKAEWKECAKIGAKLNTRLRENLERVEADSVSKLSDVNHKLEEARSTVGPLEGTVNYLNTKLKVRITQVENQGLQLVRKENLLESRARSLRLLNEQLNTNAQRVRRKDQIILENQSRIRQLDQTKKDLEAELKIKDDRLTSNATNMYDTALEIRGLKTQASRAAKEADTQRSIVTRRDHRISGLEDANKELNASKRRLGFNLDSKALELNMNASTIKSREQCIQELEETNQTLLQEKIESDTAMTKLKEDLFRLKSNLDTKKNKLTSQITLTSQRDARIRELKTANASLCQAQADANREMDGLKSRLSKLALDSKTKNMELESSISGVAQRDTKIQGLEITNAGLLRAQEVAKNDKVELDTALKFADDRIDDLEGRLNTRDGELRVATEEIKRTRRRLEDVEKGLLAEKRANITASLENLLENADDKLETLSKDLNDKTECLRKEKSANAILIKDVERLGKELLNSSEEKEISVKAKKELEEVQSLDKATIQSLQKDAASNLTLLDRLQTRCTLHDAERTLLLRQLMVESMRLHCAVEELPKDLTGTISDTQDVRIFDGVQAGDAVVVRARRFLEERKAFIILEKGDHTRIVWHESLDRCAVDMLEDVWYLLLGKGPNEAPIEIRIDSVDPYYLEEWLAGLDSEFTSR